MPEDSELVGRYSTTADQWVRAVMVRTVTGHTTGPSGSSRDISGPADLNVMTLLRALSDAVLVGARTAALDDYGPIRVRPSRRHLRPSPPRLVIVSNSGRVEQTDRLQNARPLIVTTETGAAMCSFDDVVVCGTDQVDLHLMMVQLRARDLNHITCEGGATLLAPLLKARLIDEVDETVSPVQSTNGPLLPRFDGFTSQLVFSSDGFDFIRHLRTDRE